MNGMITVAKNSDNIDFLTYSYSIGVRDFRLNMDYEKEACKSLKMIHSLGLLGIQIFADFQGVKMRIQLENGMNDLQYSIGEAIFLYTDSSKYPYITNYRYVSEYVKKGCTISFADGKIEATIKDVYPDCINILFTKVEYVLRQNSGCAISGHNIPTPCMTRSACEIISQSFAIKNKMVDWVILSFVESANEIKDFIDNMHKIGIKVMAKIETRNGVKNIKSIATVVDGFMIGRGDLKNTTQEKYKALYCKAIKEISCYRNLYNGVGTFFLSKYSQTKELSTDELIDIENVKKHGFDYVMLSKEVVNSKYPYDTIKKLQEICKL